LDEGIELSFLISAFALDIRYIITDF
jgi:hypothetical protein